MDEFVDGLRGVNKAYVGQNANHIHVCEIKVLGMINNIKKSKVEKACPKMVKYKNMNSFENKCDYCIHNRCISLTDSGNHITDIS